SLLGCFMFSGDDVFKPLGVLSGGERNRYAMAKMLVSPANMLLLDEPTNHLDLRAKDVLLEAIANFTGTVLFVSHDRYFIDGLATRVFEVEDHRVHIFPGNYEDYLWRKSGGPEKVAVSLTDSLKPTPPSSVILSEGAAEVEGPAVEAATESAESPKPPAKRLNPIKLKKLEDRVAAIEQELAAIDSRIAAVEESLGHYISAEESQRTAASLDELRTQRTTLLAEWESLATALEEQSSPSIV
ncbi:MAG: ATP-binding cassette domain-containing protein, partial [Acidobacteriaceae bacterium]